MSLNCGLARRKGYLSQKEREVELCVVGRDAQIDRPVIRANPFIRVHKKKNVVCLRATHSVVLLLNESTFLNESNESMIQWPIHIDS